MGIEIESLSELSETQVNQLFDTITQLVLEAHPTIQTRRGVVHDIVLFLAAELAAARRESVTRLQQSMSLKAIQENPELADDEIVDAVFSNYNITRQAGAPARGQVTIVLNSQTLITIAQGTVFEANGQQFTADAAYAVRLDEANVILANDRLLEPVGDGTYRFTIDVTATTDGVAGQLRRSTQLVPQTTIPRLQTAYAASDFTGGVDEETNAELLARQQEGIAAKTFSARPNIKALIREQDDFETTRGISIVGMQQPEMQRDQHGLCPVSGGGRVDVYVRTRDLPQLVGLTKTATLIEKTGTGSIWQFSLTRDEAPGFYEVTRINLPTSSAADAGFEVTQQTQSFYLGDDDFQPDIVSALEAGFTRYKTVSIRFLDTDTDVSALTENVSTQDYDIAVSVLPNIAEIQDFLVDDDVLAPGTDVLVKAAVPLFLRLNFEVEYSGTETVDEDALAQALADRVNSLSFVKKLYASDLLRVVQDLLPEGANAGALDMFGRILTPELNRLFVRDSSILQIPYLPDQLVTWRTVCPYLDPRDVAISVVQP